jgi:hypothetical protein
MRWSASTLIVGPGQLDRDALRRFLRLLALAGTKLWFRKAAKPCDGAGPQVQAFSPAGTDNVRLM